MENCQMPMSASLLTAARYMLAQLSSNNLHFTAQFSIKMETSSCLSEVINHVQEAQPAPRHRGAACTSAARSATRPTAPQRSASLHRLHTRIALRGPSQSSRLQI